MCFVMIKDDTQKWACMDILILCSMLCFAYVLYINM